MINLNGLHPNVDSSRFLTNPPVSFCHYHRGEQRLKLIFFSTNISTMSSCALFCTWTALWTPLANNGGKRGGGGGSWGEKLDVEDVGVADARRELQISNCRICSETGGSTSMCL